MRAARLATIVVLASTGLWSSQAGAVPLAPHRAVYDLALSEATDRSGITGLSGRMVYEFNGSACEGYTVKFRFVTRIETSEVSRLTDQQTTTTTRLTPTWRRSTPWASSPSSPCWPRWTR